MFSKKATIIEEIFTVDLPLCKAELLQLNRTQFLPWAIMLVKKLEIEKTKTTFNISVLKVMY
jgi:hypothetical protein